MDLLKRIVRSGSKWSMSLHYCIFRCFADCLSVSQCDQTWRIAPSKDAWLMDSCYRSRTNMRNSCSPEIRGISCLWALILRRHPCFIHKALADKQIHPLYAQPSVPYLPSSPSTQSHPVCSSREDPRDPGRVFPAPGAPALALDALDARCVVERFKN